MAESSEQAIMLWLWLERTTLALTSTPWKEKSHVTLEPIKLPAGTSLSVSCWPRSWWKWTKVVARLPLSRIFLLIAVSQVREIWKRVLSVKPLNVQKSMFYRTAVEKKGRRNGVSTSETQSNLVLIILWKSSESTATPKIGAWSNMAKYALCCIATIEIKIAGSINSWGHGSIPNTHMFFNWKN